MVRKSPQQEADEYVDRLAAVTEWLGIRVEQYPAWTVAALERELALMNRLARPFRERGDENAAALLKQIDARNAHLRRLIQHWSNVAARPHSLRR
jgi:sigma54-dependent transcription regulator